uniref:matrix-remodeling-associated protein 7-like isoform X1 n=1 Tax=Pristiophorus japonicus TaxID=55135 RepID=UPI00398F1337
MEVAVDAYLVVPLLFTVLAVLIASLYLKFRPSDASAKDEAPSCKVAESSAAEEPAGDAGEEAKHPEDGSEERAEKSVDEPGKAKGKVTVEELGAEESKLQSEDPNQKSEKELASPEKSPQTSEAKQEPSHPEEKLKKEEDEAEVASTKKSLPDEDNEDLVDEYRPGKIRGSSYEKTLTREELEEEQRVELTPDFTSV